MPDIIEYHFKSKETLKKKIKLLITKIRGNTIYHYLQMLTFRYVLLRNTLSHFLSIPFTIKKLKENSDYYFFPLHVYEDSQLTYRNTFYKDQSVIIKQLVRFLPSGAKLIVKAHPGITGYLSPKLLIYTIMNKKVQVLSKNTPATSILHLLKGVFVINSTVGVEAIKQKIPLVILGNWGIGNLMAVPKISPNDHLGLQKSFLEMRNKTFQINYDQCLDTLKRYSHKGNVYVPTKDLQFEEISDSILKIFLHSLK